jgi:hypothetical protein
VTFGTDVRTDGSVRFLDTCESSEEVARSQTALRKACQA